jgi:hypothetical protein
LIACFQGLVFVTLLSLVGLINGMGICDLEHAGRDACSYAGPRYNIHCIYNPTHQRNNGDAVGFARDVLRMKAVDGGSYSRVSYLAAQQIVDFLLTSPNFLIC